MNGTTPAPRVLGHFRLPLGMLLVATVYGTVGYWLFPGWSLVDAFYMTVLTLTTVGYREVHPLGTGGKLFTVSLLVFGLAALFTAIGVAAHLVVSGDFGKSLRRRSVRKDIDRLQDHYVVCAYGRVGRSVVQEFREQEVPVVVIDTDASLEPLLQDADVPYLIADPTDEAILRRVAVERAKGLVCAVDSDAVNVYITLTARALNPRLVIVARASRAESADKLEQAGADHVISPYAVSGRRMAFLSLRPSVIDFIDMVTVAPELRIDEILVRPGSALDGKTVAQAASAYEGVTILALKKKLEAALVAPPRQETVLAPGDLVVAYGPRAGLQGMEV